jgi:hypothetical protein
VHGLCYAHREKKKRQESKHLHKSTTQCTSNYDTSTLVIYYLYHNSSTVRGTVFSPHSFPSDLMLMILFNFFKAMTSTKLHPIAVNQPKHASSILHPNLLNITAPVGQMCSYQLCLECLSHTFPPWHTYSQNTPRM